MSSKIRYMYLRETNGNPVGCVAIRLHRKKGFLEYQVSTVNPVDRIHHLTGRSLPFNRVMARRLALGRLVEEGLCVPINSDISMIEVSKVVMTDLASFPNPSRKGDIPSRAIKAAKLWLQSNNRTASK